MSKVPYFKAGEIAPRTWMIEYAFTAPKGGGPYAYLLEGSDYALVIDTMLGYGNLRAFCETLTDKPLRLVNTHFHPDHVDLAARFLAEYKDETLVPRQGEIQKVMLLSYDEAMQCFEYESSRRILTSAYCFLGHL